MDEMYYHKYSKKLLFILAIILSGCQSVKSRGEEKIVYRDRVVYQEKQCTQQIDVKKIECIASCRKELIDKMDWCYRDSKNFTSKNTIIGRTNYLNKVKSCIATTNKFSVYIPGVEVCEKYCDQ